MSRLSAAAKSLAGICAGRANQPTLWKSFGLALRAKALAQVESREGRVYMLYPPLEKAEEEEWTLQSQIVAEGQPILALPEIGLDAQGKATFPTDSTAQALSDLEQQKALAAFMVKAYETNIGPITVKKQDTGFYERYGGKRAKVVAAH